MVFIPDAVASRLDQRCITWPMFKVAGQDHPRCGTCDGCVSHEWLKGVHVLPREVTPTHRYEDVLDLITSHPTGGPVDLELEEGETAWDPTSTKTLLRGPARVRYQRHADGGWSASLEEAR